MTAKEIAKIRRLIAQATPGPWVADVDQFSEEEGRVICVSDTEVKMLVKIELEQAEAASQSQEMRDGQFIAASREAVPALLDEVVRLRARVARLRKKMRRRAL